MCVNGSLQLVEHKCKYKSKKRKSQQSKIEECFFLSFFCLVCAHVLTFHTVDQCPLINPLVDILRLVYLPTRADTNTIKKACAASIKITPRPHQSRNHTLVLPLLMPHALAAASLKSIEKKIWGKVTWPLKQYQVVLIY